MHFDFESTFDFEATTSHLLVIIQIYKMFGGFLHLIRLSPQMSDETLSIVKKPFPFVRLGKQKGREKEVYKLFIVVPISPIRWVTELRDI